VKTTIQTEDRNVPENRSNDAVDACSYWDNGECTGTPYCPPRCPRFVDSDGVPLLVRPYEDADFDALVDMYNDLDLENQTLGLPPRHRRGIEEWLTKLTREGWNLVVVDDRIVGHVGVVPTAATDPQFVIFVHDDYQNRGIGSELLEHLLAHADAHGHEMLRLTVSKENHRAIAVYRNVDFEVTDEQAAELRMHLDLDSELVERVQRPPVER